MSGERFTLDTNVLFYHLDTSSGPRHERAIQIVERAAALDCWLTLQSVSEFYAAVTRKGVVAPARAAAVANDWLEAFPSAASSASAVRAALAAAASGRVSYWMRCLWPPRRRPGAPPS
jgi:predicted nucleic acid-binding protein